MNGSHHVPITKSTLFVVSKDEWDTKEGTGNSMKNALSKQQCSKRPLLSWSSEKIKLAIAELCLSEGLSVRRSVRQSVRRSVRQSVGQLVKSGSNSISTKFHYIIFKKNSIATFWKHLGSIWKLFWGYMSCKELWLVFRWIYFVVCPKNLLWTTTVVHDFTMCSYLNEFCKVTAQPFFRKKTACISTIQQLRKNANFMKS